MSVLDTTVLVYAKGADHPLRDPCRQLIAAIAARRLEATTTVEAIQELVHVRARHRDRARLCRAPFSAAGARALVSADSDYAELKAIEHVVPDEAGVATLLG
jgi:predicted nucleic acid-binding protein